MPPKKKGGGKKKAGKKTGGSKGPTIIDGVPVSEMSKEQLEGHVRRLQEEVSLSRVEFFITLLVPGNGRCRRLCVIVGIPKHFVKAYLFRSEFETFGQIFLCTKG